MSKHIIQEAKRCLNCKKPLCQAACPISTNIPAFIQNFLKGDIEKAGKEIFENNPLSVVCSIVCPHEVQCEGGCILGRKGDSVNISIIENYISDYYLSKSKADHISKKRGRVAVIGSGPAGITASLILAQKGYLVTLFESQDKIGGFLRYGIPQFRLPDRVLDIYHNMLKSLGVKIRPNTLIGPTITIDTLFRDDYDAIFIGTGVWNPNMIHIKGESLGHVHYAVSYLRSPDTFDLGEKVAIIGGGNTAMDVARTAVRNGAKEVTVLYRRDEEHMPAVQSEIDLAKHDGVRFEFRVSPVEIMDQQIKCIKNDIQGGKLRPIEGSEYLIDVDSVMIATSQGPSRNIASHTTGISMNESGLAKVDENGMTTREGVFAAGDVVTGARTVVQAVHDTRNVCDAIERYIDKKYGEEIQLESLVGIN